MSLLTVKGLNQSYGGSRTLWDIDLEVAAGSRTCLMGRNGMGKTTLLKCLMGLLPSTSSAMTFAGTDLRKLRAEERARLGIGYVPQGRDVFPYLTVEENLQIGVGVRSNGRRGIPGQIFELFPVLKDMLRRRGGDLSGGQQQQLAIGRALVLEPRFLILDEPTEGIQPNIVHQIGDAILTLNRASISSPDLKVGPTPGAVVQEIVDAIVTVNEEWGVTVLLVEQKLPFARRIATEFRIVEKGRIVTGGSIDALADEVVNAHLKV